jgi:hypothetical protein
MALNKPQISSPIPVPQTICRTTEKKNKFHFKIPSSMNNYYLKVIPEQP